MSATSISDNSFETRNVLTRSHTARHTPMNDSPDDEINANNGILETNEAQTLDILPVPLLALKVLENQKYDQFVQCILATKA